MSLCRAEQRSFRDTGAQWFGTTSRFTNGSQSLPIPLRVFRGHADRVDLEDKLQSGCGHQENQEQCRDRAMSGSVGEKTICLEQAAPILGCSTRRSTQKWLDVETRTNNPPPSGGSPDSASNSNLTINVCCQMLLVMFNGSSTDVHC